MSTSSQLSQDYNYREKDAGYVHNTHARIDVIVYIPLLNM